ncbi:MAG: NTP transferase domain-containing protein [Muribaculaceae bacterium]|nr:NTP transferase domain-containing protein [Muribaculaceae bacterium]
MNYAIIAAGEGSRLAQEGVQKPKPLVQLNGEPMIGRLISIFDSLNAESISVIVNNEMVEVQDYLQSVTTQCPLNIVVKSTPSSMHSFYELSKIMKPGKFCLTTVDTIFRVSDFAPYIKAFEAEDNFDGMMAVTPFIDDEKPLYVATDEHDVITAFCDSFQPGIKYVSGGVYALSDKAFPVLNRCIDSGISRMRNFQRALIEGGLSLKAYPIPKIVDVDHVGDIIKAEQFISEQ